MSLKAQKFDAKTKKLENVFALKKSNIFDPFPVYGKIEFGEIESKNTESQKTESQKTESQKTDSQKTESGKTKCVKMEKREDQVREDKAWENIAQIDQVYESQALISQLASGFKALLMCLACQDQLV